MGLTNDPILIRSRCRHCPTDAHTTEQHEASEDDETRKARADARALWAVRVLDAWAADPEEERHWSCGDQVVLYRHGEDGAPDTFEAETLDAARDAAAQAVFPTLPADVRAKLGERP